MIVVYGLMAFLTCVFIMFTAIEGKLDWTKDKELLLWYTEVNEEIGKRERKFITILKL